METAKFDCSPSQITYRVRLSRNAATIVRADRILRVLFSDAWEDKEERRFTISEEVSDPRARYMRLFYLDGENL